MNDDSKLEKKPEEMTAKGFLSQFLTGLARDAFNLIIAFGVGTGAGAIACWYFQVPLILSLLGGILVLGLAVALMSDSLFF